MNEIKYTICFCRCNNRILMVYRSKEPNKNHWNGLGGKIEEGENVLDSVKREILEEANIDISKNGNILFSGIVTWNKNDENNSRGGMYAFIVDIPESSVFDKEVITREGILAWKDIDWVSGRLNTEVVSNIPRFLPHMLKLKKPNEYRLFYKYQKLQKMNIHLLPPIFLIQPV